VVDHLDRNPAGGRFGKGREVWRRRVAQALGLFSAFKVVFSAFCTDRERKNILPFFLETSKK
jgi:hypothetical protein